MPVNATVRDEVSQTIRRAPRSSFWARIFACVSLTILSACGGDGQGPVVVPEPTVPAAPPAPFGSWTTGAEIRADQLTGPTDGSVSLQFVSDSAGGILAYSNVYKFEQAGSTSRAVFYRFTPSRGWIDSYVIHSSANVTAQAIPFRDSVKQDGVMVVIPLADRTVTQVVYDGNRWMLPVTTLGPPRDFTLMADGSLLRTRVVSDPAPYVEASRFSNGEWQSYKQFPLEIAALTPADKLGRVRLYEYRDGIYGELRVARESDMVGLYPCGEGSVIALSGASVGGSTLAGTRNTPTYCTPNGLAGSNELRDITALASGGLARLCCSGFFPVASVRTAGAWVESNIGLNSASSGNHAYTNQGDLVAYGHVKSTYDPLVDPGTNVYEGATLITFQRESDGVQRPAMGRYAGPISQTAQFAIMQNYAAGLASSPGWNVYERLTFASYLERTDFASSAFDRAYAIESGNSQYSVFLKGTGNTASNPRLVTVKWRSR